MSPFRHAINGFSCTSGAQALYPVYSALWGCPTRIVLSPLTRKLVGRIIRQARHGHEPIVKGVCGRAAECALVLRSGRTRPCAFTRIHPTPQRLGHSGSEPSSAGRSAKGRTGWMIGSARVWAAFLGLLPSGRSGNQGSSIWRMGLPATPVFHLPRLLSTDAEGDGGGSGWGVLGVAVPRRIGRPRTSGAGRKGRSRRRSHPFGRGVLRSGNNKRLEHTATNIA